MQVAAILGCWLISKNAYLLNLAPLQICSAASLKKATLSLTPPAKLPTLLMVLLHIRETFGCVSAQALSADHLVRPASGLCAVV